MKTLTLLLLLTSASFAQSVKGDIRKIDLENGRITITHAPIKNLDMGEMTMGFRITPELGKDLKVGDKILFDADRVDGAISVTKVKKQ
jgi:Cu(I)/Ag(I) efflux system periplasmic protein CusF